LSGKAISRINDSKIDRLVVTDTIPLCDAARQCSTIEQLSLDRLLGEAIRRVSNEESISAMFR
jgi:ribose-phosphate pyrophosphokinase